MKTVAADPLFDRIIADTFTTQSLRRRIPLARDYFQKTLFGGEFIKPTDLEARDHTWLLTLTEEYETHANSVLRTITKENVGEIFAQLEEKTTKISPIVIFLPILLPPDEIDNLGRALRRVYGKEFFAELRLDPLLIAGAAFAWKGVYKDYSLRQKIRDNQDEILKSFAKYTQK